MQVCVHQRRLPLTRVPAAYAPPPLGAPAQRLWGLRRAAPAPRQLHEAKAVSLDQAFPTAPGAQQLRDFHIGLPYGLLCVTAAVLGSCPVIGAAGCAVLGASWCSLQAWKQQHRAFGGFLHWFAASLMVVAYQLGGLSALPAVHPALRLLFPATVLATMLYGTSAGSYMAAAAPPADSHPSSSNGGGSARGGQPPEGDDADEGADEGQRIANDGGKGPASGAVLRAASVTAPPPVKTSNLLSASAIASPPLSPPPSPTGARLGSANIAPPPGTSDGGNGSLHGAHMKSLDEADQAMIDQAVHQAFEHELESVNEAVSAAVESAVESAIADSQLHFDVRANFNTLIALSGAILYWRGIWTAWDVLFGYGFWSEVAAIGIGLGIMLSFRLFKIPLAEGFPSS